MIGLLLVVALLLVSPASARPSNLQAQRPVRDWLTRLIGGSLISVCSFAAVEATVQTHQRVSLAAVRARHHGTEMVVCSTAYCLTGRTATGTFTRHGTIAVDPQVIPLGTRLYVPGYGWGRALDTGGLIRGRIIDVWLPTATKCYDWGRRTITITIY